MSQSSSALRREQTEPTMKYTNNNIPSQSSNPPSSTTAPVKKEQKRKLEVVAMKTKFSNFYSNKENLPKTQPEAKMSVGCNKPPKGRSSQSVLGSPRYLQPTESSFRRSSLAEPEDSDLLKTDSKRQKRSRLIMCNLCYRNFGR